MYVQPFGLPGRRLEGDALDGLSGTFQLGSVWRKHTYFFLPRIKSTISLDDTGALSLKKNILDSYSCSSGGFFLHIIRLIAWEI